MGVSERWKWLGQRAVALEEAASLCHLHWPASCEDIKRFMGLGRSSVFELAVAELELACEVTSVSIDCNDCLCEDRWLRVRKHRHSENIFPVAIDRGRLLGISKQGAVELGRAHHTVMWFGVSWVKVDVDCLFLKDFNLKDVVDRVPCHLRSSLYGLFFFSSCAVDLRTSKFEKILTYWLIISLQTSFQLVKFGLEGCEAAS